MSVGDVASLRRYILEHDAGMGCRELSRWIEEVKPFLSERVDARLFLLLVMFLGSGYLYVTACSYSLGFRFEELKDLKSFVEESIRLEVLVRGS